MGSEKNGRRRWCGREARPLALTYVLVALVAPVAWAAVPEPSAVVYGMGVVPLPNGALVEARVGAEQVASYAIGSIPAAGNSYVLAIPLESPTGVAEPRTPGVARLGDLVELYVNAVSTGSTLALNQRGQVVQIILDAGGDIFAPTPPTSLLSSSHTPDQWSNDATVDLTWSGAVDGQGGLSGYSVLNNTAASSEPDSSVDVAQAGDPHQLTIGPLGDAATHWFHLRACDLAGNCSTTVRVGPFKIDTTPPGAPTNLVRTSLVGAPTLAVTWAAPGDAASGVDGYGWDFSQTPTGSCPGIVLGSGTTATSDPLADGDWYAHVCAVDAAGNWGAVASAGPFEMESAAPQVTSVATVGPTADGVLDQDEGVVVAVTQVVVRFSEEMNDPVGNSSPFDVTNPANYLLVAAGDDGTVETLDCSAGPDAEDVGITVTGVTHDAAAQTATLLLDVPRGLPAGRQRLLACGSIGLQDLAGKALDGDGNGSAGDDFALDFEVLSENRLTNPNFDDGLNSWSFSGPLSAGLFASTEDLGEAATSGSAEVTGVASGAQIWTIDQCVPVEAGTAYQMDGFARIDSGGTPTAALVVEFHRNAACSTLEQVVVAAAFSGDTGGVFQRLESDPIEAPATLEPSEAFARTRLVVSTQASAAFSVLFDSVSFYAVPVIHADGFESGDTSGWSSTVGGLQ